MEEGTYKLAHYNEAGEIHFYDPELHYPGGIPEPNIKVSDDDFMRHVRGEVIWRVNPKSKKIFEYTPPPPSIDALKQSAIREATNRAMAVRRELIRAAPPERLVGWATKSMFAMVSVVHEALADGDTKKAFKPFAHIAGDGFDIEAQTTGEDAATLMKKSLDKASVLFRANQLVEGMERMAEHVIGAAKTEKELDVAIAQLSKLEAAAKASLDKMRAG